MLALDAARIWVPNMIIQFQRLKSLQVHTDQDESHSSETAYWIHPIVNMRNEQQNHVSKYVMEIYIISCQECFQVVLTMRSIQITLEY